MGLFVEYKCFYGFKRSQCEDSMESSDVKFMNVRKMDWQNMEGIFNE